MPRADNPEGKKKRERAELVVWAIACDPNWPTGGSRNYGIMSKADLEELYGTFKKERLIQAAARAD